MPRLRDRSVFRHLGKIVYPLHGAYLFPSGIVSRHTKLLLDLCLSSRYDFPRSPAEGLPPCQPLRWFEADEIPRSWRMGGASCRRPQTASSVGNPTLSTVKTGSGNC